MNLKINYSQRNICAELYPIWPIIQLLNRIHSRWSLYVVVSSMKYKELKPLHAAKSSKQDQTHCCYWLNQNGELAVLISHISLKIVLG